jgi:hypothetical protein
MPQSTGLSLGVSDAQLHTGKERTRCEKAKHCIVVYSKNAIAGKGPNLYLPADELVHPTFVFFLTYPYLFD